MGDRFYLKQKEFLQRHDSSSMSPGGLLPPDPSGQVTPSEPPGGSFSKLVIYPFRCIRCGKTIARRNHKKVTKAHKSRLCILRCDGVIRDKGGFPVDEKLRAEYIEKINAERSAHRESQLAKHSTAKRIAQKKPDPGFYLSREWRSLRYKVLLHYGKKCMACESITGPFHVDHILPRSKHPELELVFSNL